MGPVSTEASGARRRLSAALRSVLLAGKQVPCERDSSLWMSNVPADREAAAHRCARCPVRMECAAASQYERIGVWGSQIRSSGSRDW